MGLKLDANFPRRNLRLTLMQFATASGIIQHCLSMLPSIVKYWSMYPQLELSAVEHHLVLNGTQLLFPSLFVQPNKLSCRCYQIHEKQLDSNFVCGLMYF
jgi:hypothetical protein